MIWTIYLIAHEAVGKCYVGRTKQDIRIRWAGHVFAAKTRPQPISVAIREHGREAFRLVPLGTRDTIEAANAAEQLWIAAFRSDDPSYGYNVEAGGNAKNQTADVKRRLSEQTRERMKDPATRARFSRLGFKHTEASKALMSAGNRAAALRRYADPEFRKRHADLNRATAARLMAARKKEA